jgi:hypothetical protein
VQAGGEERKKAVKRWVLGADKYHWGFRSFESERVAWFF